ncbi:MULTISPECIES: DODA-type extradiol aromatic ring-opening family dioxygenase [unclassified Psychrobacter]|jgi:4,5-DOPA dioxygenase extradiol|uniref:DODA-type extradiol aromatic ring-opening family dioxygenase n=1 Tax=unclassified Psychrobacter TaxID=196806 RepID=UPI000C34991D|nr:MULTISPECIES: class III extradiol ring-cleavage dioxygenase [unclassified Psychrobacter]MBA6243489.1 dioxygenase [Psychrobacter sp. Urea-trap-18]MBA6286095.1 dioxygenase [Psychrobacter sp. Urea-trap-16]MBA6317262.1 dioxygenase [Psychrobacter sp. Urea-trap-20]MBA6333408.1 dioxygenase [Psychrobacter sp. Urea-trap-19]PKG61008.1 dioxygenase [Psychrobacter sp. Choline-3u-12]
MKYPKRATPNTSKSSQQRDDHHSVQTPITAAAAWENTSDVATNTSKLPALFISHGAPTLAIEQSATTSALARIGQNLPKPRAIVIMSAHWQSAKLEISSNPQPKTWHDFSGFSPELYDIQYPATGQPALAETLAQQLTARGITCSVNPVRACDHGVWAPLRHLYPEADVPIVQISLPQHYDSIACYQLGAQLAHLRDEQILVIGSGNITHNLQALRWEADSIDQAAKAFKQWLLQQLKIDIPTALDWQQYPDYKDIHPSDEHLLPLFFALGNGQRVSVVHQSMAHHSLGMDIYRFD